MNHKLINKRKNQRINSNISLDNQYTFENSKKSLYYNSTINLENEGEEIERKEFIKKYFSNICYFSVLSLKEFEKDCIFCVSGKAFKFIIKNKSQPQYSNLLNILLKNTKIFFSMTSLDKSFLIDYYRDLPSKITCMIGNESSDIDSIITAHVGITLKKPSNANMILCHFYLPSKNLMKVKDLIEHSRAVVENNFLLFFSSLFCTTIIETFIGYSFIKSRDVNPALLRIINIFYYFLSLFGFTNSVDNNSNNNLKKSSHLFVKYIIVHIIGNIIIKTLAMGFFFALYRGNSLIEEYRRNNINSSYFAILTMNLIFTTLIGFNFVRFYRNSIIDNYMFLFTLIIFMILILINTCLSKIGLATFITKFFSFENLKSKSDTFDDRNKLIMFGIIGFDLTSTIIFIIIIQFIFNKTADNNVKKNKIK
jgi:magnesium-transporting ATPase (P-type)